MASTKQLHAAHLFSTSGSVCVVTGGGTGIGLMAAQALAANGARVYITSRRGEVIGSSADFHDPDTGGEIIACEPCDVTSKDELEKLVKEISSKEKKVDILVTAAGVGGPGGDPNEPDTNQMKANLWNNESVESWNSVYNTNVTSVYFTTVAFLPLLQAASQKAGELAAGVITISSMSGIMRHAQKHFSYNASKGGTIQLTKLMSAEFQRAGIRVNSIAPGYFPSEMTAKDSGPDQKSSVSDEWVQKKGHTPIQRPGKDSEMAQAVLLLACNRYVNGEILAVDGSVLNVVGGR